MKETIEYEKTSDGQLIKVHTARGSPIERKEVVREWNGLIGQQENLLKDLAICRERLVQLKPVVDSITAEIEAEHDEALEEESVDETAKLPQHVVDWADERKKKAARTDKKVNDN